MRILTISVALFASQLLLGQKNTEDVQRVWMDSISQVYSVINPITPCGKDYFSAMDEEPNFKEPFEKLLQQMDYGDSYFTFFLSCDVNCKGEVGNWQASLDFENILSDAKVVPLLNQLAALLKLMKPIVPGSRKGQNSDYRYSDFRVKIANGKATTTL